MAQLLVPLVAQALATPVFVQAIGWMSFLSRTASGVLLLLFTLAMGAELRERLAQEDEYDAGTSR